MSGNTRDNELIQSTLELSERAFKELFPILPKEWLSLDLSTPQLKVVLLLLVNGPCRMSVIASALGVSLATGTGVVDRLVERGIVVREGDPEDRRVVLCRLSNKGEKMLLGLVQLARNHAELMFRSLSPEKLMAVRAGLEALLEAGAATKKQLGIATPNASLVTSKRRRTARPLAEVGFEAAGPRRRRAHHSPPIAPPSALPSNDRSIGFMPGPGDVSQSAGS